MCQKRTESICFPNRCGLNGLCKPGLKPDEFSCECYPGYFGDFCESVLEGIIL